MQGVGLVPMPGRLRGGVRVGARVARRITFFLTPGVARELERRALDRGVNASRLLDELLAREFGVRSDFAAEAAE